MKACNDYIMVVKDRVGRTPSGLILPYTDYDGKNIRAPFTGVVKSVGEDVKSVKAGERIVFSDLAQPYVLIDEKDIILFLRNNDIIGILKNDGE